MARVLGDRRDGCGPRTFRTTWARARAPRCSTCPMVRASWRWCNARSPIGSWRVPADRAYGAASLRVAYRARRPSFAACRPRCSGHDPRSGRRSSGSTSVAPPRRRRRGAALGGRRRSFAQRRKTMRNALRRLGLATEGRTPSSRQRGSTRRPGPRRWLSRRSPASLRAPAPRFHCPARAMTASGTAGPREAQRVPPGARRARGRLSRLSRR